MPTKGLLLDCRVGGKTRGVEAQLPHGRGCCPQDGRAHCWRGPSAPWCVCSEGERFQRPPRHLGESEFFNEEDRFGGRRECNSSLQIPDWLSSGGIHCSALERRIPALGCRPGPLGTVGCLESWWVSRCWVCPLA